MYYELDNFKAIKDQNSYGKSRDVGQLKGIIATKASTDCQPLQNCDGPKCTNGYVLRHPDSYPTGLLTGTPPFFPCGTAANSFFSGKTQLNK